MLHNFRHEIYSLFAFTAFDMNSGVNGRQVFICRKSNVNNRADDLDDFTKIITHEEVLLSTLSLQPYCNALAPLTISVSSFVIPAWRTLL